MIKQVFGVFDCLSAKIALSCGVDYFYLGGFSVAASLLGVPDVGLVSQSEIISVAQNIKRVIGDKYFIIDGDTGFGGDQNIRRLISDVHFIGANAVTLEDQQMPKKCGHMPVEHKLVSTEEHANRIKEAVDQRAILNSTIDIIARTDIRNYGTVADVVERSIAYVESGADIIFLEAIKNKQEFSEIREALPGVKLLANVPESTNKMDLLSANDLSQIGIDYILHPVTTLFSSALAMQNQVKNVLKNGKPDINGIMPLDNYFDLIELRKYM